MATVSAARTINPVGADPTALRQHLPVLRWTYRRDGEQLECELSLTAAMDGYDFRVFPVRFSHAPASELFDDALSALQRQVSLEQALIRDGWHLDQFERGQR